MGTLMRSISLLEDRGHTCRIYVMYKGVRRDLDRVIAARERFPQVRAEIADVADGMAPADAVFATALAHRLHRAEQPGAGSALLPGAGLRADVLPVEQQRDAGRGDLPVRLPRHHRRAVAHREARTATTA